MSDKPRLIIDCDPGVDDALAILYAFSKKNIDPYSDIAITTVAGNVGCNQTTANAIKLVVLKKPGIDVIIFKGCSMAMDGKLPSAASVHGRDGLGEVPIRFIDEGLNIEYAITKMREFEKKNIENGKDAVSFFTELVSNHSAEKPKNVLVCTGPLTNIATVLNLIGRNQHHKFWSSFKTVVIMGGAIHVPGNVTPFAEFNFFADPMAARIVLDSWKDIPSKQKSTDLILVTLDVTEKVDIQWSELSTKLEPDSLDVVPRFVSCMLQKYFLFHGVMANPVRDKDGKRIKDKAINKFRRSLAEEFTKKRLGGSSGLKSLFRFCYLHDPLAMYVALNASEMRKYCKKITLAVSIDPGDTRGMCMEVASRPASIESLNSKGKATSHQEGATILYLDHSKFITDHFESPDKKFRKELLSALGFGNDV